jgi:hypothetical protein
MVMAPGEPLRRAGDDGAVPWRVPLVAVGDDAGNVLRVTVAGDPGVEPRTIVTVEDMAALTWKLDGRSGVSLWARSITARPDLAVVRGG